MRKNSFIKIHSHFVLLVTVISLLMGCAIDGELDTPPPTKKKMNKHTSRVREGINLNVNSVAFSDEIPLGENEKYNVKNSFKKALRDWLEYKFGTVEADAFNEIDVQILSINYDGGRNTFLKSTSVQIRLTGNINGIHFDKKMTFESNFSRSVTGNPDYKGSTITIKAKTNLDRFLMQFVEKIKNYIKDNIENLD